MFYPRNIIWIIDLDQDIVHNSRRRIDNINFHKGLLRIIPLFWRADEHGCYI